MTTPVGIRTEIDVLQRVLTTNDTTANGALSIPDDLTSDPTDNTGVWSPGLATGMVPNTGFLIPIGTDAQNETAIVAAFAIQRIGEARWTHVPAWVADYTLGSLATGETNEFYADTITAMSSNLVEAVDSSAAGSSDFGNSVAFIRWDLLGCEHWFFSFMDGASGPVASSNALVKGY